MTLLFFFCLGSHLGNLTKGDVIMSFNPIAVILEEKSEESTYKKSIKTIKDIYHSNVESISNAITTAHKEFTTTLKTIFNKLRGNNFNVDLSTSDVISKKFDKVSSGVFDILNDKITENSKSLLQYIKNTKDQVTILKRLFSAPSNLNLSKTLYTSKGVGFRSITLPTNDQYIESTYPYSKAFRDFTPLEDDSLYKKFGRCYRTEQLLAEEMYDSITYYFKPDKGYPAQSYVDIYEEMNKDMISMLAEQKKRYAEIREMLNDIHDDRTGAYDRCIVELNQKNLPPNEKEEKKRIATHNYRILSSSLIKMTDMVTVYHRIQLKILLMSYENYKEIIQRIFDDYIGDD